MCAAGNSKNWLLNLCECEESDMAEIGSGPNFGKNMNALMDMVPRNLDHQALLRTIFGGHFLLTCMVLMASWPPFAYVFYNSFLLAGLLWALSIPAVNCELPLLKCIFVDAVSVLLDILVMWSSYGIKSEFKVRGGQSKCNYFDFNGNLIVGCPVKIYGL